MAKGHCGSFAQEFRQSNILLSTITHGVFIDYVKHIKSGKSHRCNIRGNHSGVCQGLITTAKQKQKSEFNSIILKKYVCIRRLGLAPMNAAIFRL